jgi:integrase
VKGEQLLESESVQKWFESLDQSSASRGKTGLSKNARAVRLGVFTKYVEYAKMNPDQLLEEAKQDIDKTGVTLMHFFKHRVDIGLSWNTVVTNLGFIRGFYTHNNVFFPRKFPVPKRKVSATSKRDIKTEIYGYDEENGEIIFRNGTLQHFVQNLSFRDQTIVLCLLSTGADATDLFKLNVEFVKDSRGKVSDKARFFWHSNREKTGTPFKVYFSEEATEFLRRYVEQERSGADDSEPLFATEDGGRMDAHLLSINFRVGAKKMGYTTKGKASPFRPKRFRHLFRTACGNANVDNGYTEAFMGHSSTVSASYLEQGNGLFLKEYLKVEPYLTVFGVNKSKVTELSGEVEELKGSVTTLVKTEGIIQDKMASLEQSNASLVQRNTKLEAQIKSMYEFVHRNFDNLLEFVDAISDLPEFEEMKKKLVEAKETKARAEAEELE